MPRETEYFPDQVQKPLDDRAVRIEPCLDNTAVINALPVPPLHRTSQPANLQLTQSQRLADIAERTARPVGDDRGSQRCPLAAILLVDVLDDLFTTLMLEVHVDVGWFVTFPGNETLDEHFHSPGIDLSNAETKTHGRIGRRSAALTQDLLRAGKGDDVVYRQKVRLVFEVLDQRKFVFDEVNDPGWHTIRPAPLHALLSEVAQVTRRCLTIRHDFVGILVMQFVERKIDMLGNAQCLGQ